jgi:hypothetical protein
MATDLNPTELFGMKRIGSDNVCNVNYSKRNRLCFLTRAFSDTQASRIGLSAESISPEHTAECAADNAEVSTPITGTDASPEVR